MSRLVRQNNLSLVNVLIDNHGDLSLWSRTEESFVLTDAIFQTLIVVRAILAVTDLLIRIVSITAPRARL